MIFNILNILSGLALIVTAVTFGFYIVERIAAIEKRLNQIEGQDEKMPTAGIRPEKE